MPLLGGSSKPSRVDDEQDHPFPESGKTDLLLRFFDSQFFDEWIALTYVPIPCTFPMRLWYS